MHRVLSPSQRTALAMSLFLGLASKSLWGEDFKTIRSTGPSSNRIDVVFLGDGYRLNELDKYDTHIQGMLDHMFGSEEPFSRYESYFNVHKIDVVSQESGADIPPEEITVDTALGAKYYYDGATDRLLYINDGNANAIVARTLGQTDIDVNMRYVSVNSTRYGGGGGFYAVFAGGNSSAFEVALHEQGHSFSNLADEYGGFTSEYTGGEPSEVNVSKSSDGAKWQHWIGYDQPGIGVIGAYQGGKYYDRGLFRPSTNSKMRTLNRPFDAVGREKIILDIYGYVDPLDGWLANGDVVKNPASLWVDAIDPTLIQIDWKVGSIPIPTVLLTNPETLNLESIGLFPGSYMIHAHAEDRTEWVRIQRELLREAVSWNVDYFPGDYDDNRAVNALDITLLQQAIRAQDSIPLYDMNQDGVLDMIDQDRWLTLAHSYQGDVNVDHQVDFSDFLVLSAHFGLEGTWSDGNVNNDGTIGFDDFLLLSANFGIIAVDNYRDARLPAAVPEPNLTCVLAAAVCGWASIRNRRRRNSATSDGG